MFYFYFCFSSSFAKVFIWLFFFPYFLPNPNATVVPRRHTHFWGAAQLTRNGLWTNGSQIQSGKDIFERAAVISLRIRL